MAELNELSLGHLYDLCQKIIEHKKKTHTYSDVDEVRRVGFFIDTKDRTYEAALSYKEMYEKKDAAIKKLGKLASTHRHERYDRFTHGYEEAKSEMIRSLREDACALIEALNKSQKKYEKLADEVLKAVPHDNPEIRPRRP